MHLTLTIQIPTMVRAKPNEGERGNKWGKVIECYYLAKNREKVWFEKDLKTIRRVYSIGEIEHLPKTPKRRQLGKNGKSLGGLPQSFHLTVL